MAGKFEYVVVRLPDPHSKEGDRKMTNAINEVAEHGWRLVTLKPGEGKFGTPHGVFEREIEHDG